MARGTRPRWPAPCFRARVLGLGLGLATAAAGLPHSVFAQTRELLDAPQVQSRIRVQWDRSANALAFAADDDPTFRPMPRNGLFLTKTGVALTYPRINPLRVQALVTRGEAAEPGRGTVAGPLRAIMSMALIATPVTPAAATDDRDLNRSAPATSSPCPAQSVATSDVQLLARALYGGGVAAGTVAQALDGWRRTIDAGYAAGKSGADAINAALDQIAQFGRDLGAGLETAATLIKKVDAEAAKTLPADACESAARYVYEGLRLADPRARLQQLVALQHAVADLQRTLYEQYVQSANLNWTGTDYKIASEIRPTSDKSQAVVVRIVSFDFSVDELSGALLSAEETGGAATFGVRKLSRLTREFGVGTVIGSLTRPRYGTSRNAAGETVVSRIDTGPVSVHPAFLVNLVCLCNTGPFAAPMLQLGLTTSSDVFALLSGAGVRLFGAGRGDVALGGGWMVGWVKDLRTLREDDPVGGTKDIEANLESWRRSGWYVVIQYKF